MKLTILGNNGPYPAENGACSGYLLTSDSGNTNVLIECGSGVLPRLMQHIPLDRLDAVILSHLHFDHMSDMLPMQYALQFHPRKPLRLILPETPASTRALLDVPFYELLPMHEIQIGEMHFTFTPTRHPVESYALRVECDGRTLSYTGDTNTMAGLEDFFKYANVLLADAGLSQEDWKESAPHLSACGCAKLARDAEVERLFLTHLNPRYTPEDLEAQAQRIRPDAHFVRMGETLEI